jgi:hypothetical protein
VVAPTPPRLSAAAGRRFGLTLALGFAALGLLIRWRGAPAEAVATWGVAAVAALAALAVPTHLGPVERGWTAFGVALSRVTSPVFFALLWLFLLTPAGWLRRTVGRSPFVREAGAPSYWNDRAARTPEAARRSLERQF